MWPWNLNPPSMIMITDAAMAGNQKFSDLFIQSSTSQN